MSIKSINPASEEVLQEFEEFSDAAIDAALDDVSSAYDEWRRVPMAERSRLMRDAAMYLRQHKEELAGVITAEMGKPITEAESEIEKCAWNCDYYADEAARFLADEPAPSNARESYVAFDPIGPVLAIMPWNFPFWQVFRFAAPALMAGNTGVLKHASNVPQCALAIERVFTETGFPRGAFRTLLAGSEKVDEIIEDERVKAVTLTGSDVTGSKVASAAGRAIKKTVLELGGSDAFIVLADADLEPAATTGARARNQNTGQSCIAAKRFIVHEDVASEFERLLVAAVADMRLGDPSMRETQVGPLARRDLRDALASQVRRSVEMGATVSHGGVAPERKGYFYEPTVVADVTPEMPAFREETFGPLAALVRVKDADEAVAVANDSEYGLGSSVWTNDIEHAQALARRIEAGSVFINGMVASDPRLPFGGVKRSGYGRELGEFGIREFVNIKTVWIGPAEAQAPRSE